MAQPLQRIPSPHRSNLVAAGLSFIWPGLGQWYLRRPWRGVVYAAPILIVALFLALQLAAGLTAVAVRLLDPAVSLTLFFLTLLLGAWRLASILDAAGWPTSLAGLRGRALAVLAALVAGVLLTHGILAYYAWSFYEAGSRIFVSGDSGDGATDPSPGSSSNPLPTDNYNVDPFETPPTEQSRITLLLTGIDKNVDRSHSLNDTLLVISVDPETGSMAMVSFPRDIAEFPLYDGRTYHSKINSLMSYAAGRPDEFPDGPLPTLAKELGFLLGVPINYFAAVDLDGFQRMIEAVGRVTVNVERPIADPTYGWLDGSPPGFYLSAGRHQLDARTALAFVRSRSGAGDNDFTRAARQQQLLLALRAELTDPRNVSRVPAVLDAAADTVRTNFPPERLNQMLALADGLDADSTDRIVLQPPTYSVHPPTNTTGGSYILRIKWGAIRALSVRLFGPDSTFWTGTFDPSGSPIPLAAP